MGCTSSIYAFGKKKKKKMMIPEVSVYVPSFRIPVQSDIQTPLTGFIPQDLAHTITSLRNRITFVADRTEGSAINELVTALEEYLPFVLGLTNKEFGVQDLVEFRWKGIIEDGKQEIVVGNSWFELLSVLHMMASLTLMEANQKLIPEHSSHSERLVSADCMREGVDLLLKAAGYLKLCVDDILLRMPPDMKKKLAWDLQEGVVKAIVHQALAQGTEIQLGLAVQTQSATLPVKRRLACEELSYFAEAYCCLSKVVESEMGEGGGNLKKRSLFLKWKYLEAKGAAYYYHGLIIGKGGDPSSHVTALLCFLAAENLLSESKKSCLTFCLNQPITRAPPPWGAMKHLHKKIPETASKKSQMYGHLLEDIDKDVQTLPDLPEFELSLQADEYELPEMDPAVWNSGNFHGQTLKEHLHQ